MTAPCDLAERFGLKRSGRSWRGDCPACAYPGTFSIREGAAGRALFWCASCQDRDALARAVGGGTVASLPPSDAAKEAEAKAKKRDRALALWSGSAPVVGTPAASYLRLRRIGFLTGSPALRFRPDAPHPSGGRYPAMVALVSDAAGAPLAVHRTYLRPDGAKAAVDPVKASLGPVWGGAIRLAPHDPDAPLVVAEGIETAAAAGRLMRLPAWAALSAGNLAKGLVLPPDARRIVIAADPDAPGRVAAREAWFRWKAEGRDVTIATPTGDGDFNDVLCREVSHVG